MVKKKYVLLRSSRTLMACVKIFLCFLPIILKKRQYYLRELQKYLRSNCIFTYMQDLMSFGQWPILSLVRRTILLPFDKFQRFFGKSASDADKELDFTLNFLADHNLLKEKCTILTFFQSTQKECIQQHFCCQTEKIQAYLFSTLL